MGDFIMALRSISCGETNAERTEDRGIGPRVFKNTHTHDIRPSSISYHMIFDNDMILHDIDIIYLKYGRGAGTWYGSSNTATVVCATKGGTVELNIL